MSAKPMISPSDNQSTALSLCVCVYICVCVCVCSGGSLADENAFAYAPSLLLVEAVMFPSENFSHFKETLHSFGKARGGDEGGGDAGLVTAGSGGSTTSATSKAGVGELAGGCVSSGTVFSRLPASAGMMLYELSGMELEEHGFPEGDQFAGYSVMIPSTPIPEVVINSFLKTETYTEIFAACISFTTLVVPVVKPLTVGTMENLGRVTASAYFLISSTGVLGASLISSLRYSTLVYAGTFLNLDNTDVSSDWIRTFCVDCLPNVALPKAVLTADTISRPFCDARVSWQATVILERACQLSWNKKNLLSGISKDCLNKIEAAAVVSLVTSTESKQKATPSFDI
ncbi:hypothetical protein NC652_040045 [Populus alba x Populus x berolinensis]|nr:hypothetical protein NC652_040045 [Populus alba x Populus x berolinensis]